MRTKFIEAAKLKMNNETVLEGQDLKKKTTLCKKIETLLKLIFKAPLIYQIYLAKTLRAIVYRSYFFAAGGI